MSKLDEVAAIVNVLWFLPPPARTPVADGLHGLGVRVHPELATSVMITDATTGMGNHAARAPIAKQALDFLWETQPDLAEKIRIAQSDPQQREKLTAELRSKIAADTSSLRDEGAKLLAEFPE